MRCKHCRKLIIHRFNGNYTRRDKWRKRQHERTCEENPDIDSMYCNHPNLKDDILKFDNVGKHIMCIKCDKLFVVTYNPNVENKYYFKAQSVIEAEEKDRND